MLNRKLESREGQVKSVAASSTASNFTWMLATIGTNGAGGETISLESFPFSVGRRPGCSLQLGSRAVSGHHADILLQDGKLMLLDRGSTNGTFVNGQRVASPVLLAEDHIIQFADAAFRVRRNKDSDASRTVAENVCDKALALVQFDRMLQERLVTPHYQPIVRMSNSEPIGYEILARSRLFGLETPAAMFEAAAKLNQEVALSQMLRWEGVQKGISKKISGFLYVNTHPKELGSEGLVESMTQLRLFAPDQPLVLEIHEAAVTSPTEVSELAKKIRDLDIRIAYDDFGAGQGRIAELGEAPPDIIKFDMSLVRDIDRASTERQKFLKTLVTMVVDLGIEPLAEGIETDAEAAVCRELGFKSGQGFFYGRPSPNPL